MTYLFRFLLKIILLIILSLKSVSMFNYNTRVLPLLSIALLINVIYECILLIKTKSWYYLIKNSDERIQKFTLQAGYITFLINMIGILLILIFCSSQKTSLLKPLDLVGGLFVLELLIFNIIKYYYIHNEVGLSVNINMNISEKNRVSEIKSVTGKISTWLPITSIFLIINAGTINIPIKKIGGLPLTSPFYIGPIGVLLGMIPLWKHKDRFALIGVIINILLLLFTFAVYLVIIWTINL